MNQLRLFPAPKPLVDRLGEDFFRSAPRAPGVYIMCGAFDRILYIGQTKNLRARLGSYKNAKPDRAPRKVIRLVHEVESIVWERCDSAEAAKSREAELLLVHRPKFNVANTWPAPQRYISILWDGKELELDCATAPVEAPRKGGSEPAAIRRYGPFKSSATLLYGAILRLMWRALNHAESDFPCGFFSDKPLRPFRFQAPSDEITLKLMFDALCDHFEGNSSALVSLLKPTADGDTPETNHLGDQPKIISDSPLPFRTALQVRDLEIVEGFLFQAPVF